jgi:FkbM family methyltransferase
MTTSENIFEKAWKALVRVEIFSGVSSLRAIIFLLCALVVIILHYEDDYSKNEKYKLCRTNQDLWIAVIENDLVSSFIANDSVWEPNVTNYLVANIKPGEIIVEIGGNIGYYTTLMAKLVSPSGKVYSYEANDEVYNLANLSLKMNDLSDIATIKNVAISDKDGEVNFVIPLQKKYSDFVNIGTAHIAAGEAEDSTSDIKIKKVKTTFLDADLPNLENVDWLRMDIEGSEIMALKGARRIIESSPKLKIVMEWAPRMMKNYGNVSKLIDDMHSYGFRFYNILEHNKLSDQLSKEHLLNVKNLEDVVLLRSDPCETNE